MGKFAKGRFYRKTFHLCDPTEKKKGGGKIVRRERSHET